MCRFHNEEYVAYLEQYVSKDIVAKYNSIGMNPSSSSAVNTFNYSTQAPTTTMSASTSSQNMPSFLTSTIPASGPTVFTSSLPTNSLNSSLSASLTVSP